MKVPNAHRHEAEQWQGQNYHGNTHEICMLEVKKPTCIGIVCMLLCLLKHHISTHHEQLLPLFRF